MPRNLLLILIIVLVILGISLVLISNRAAEKAPESSVTQPQITASPTSLPSSSPSAQVMKEITVIGSEFKFEPDTLTLKNGDRVRITFINEGTFPHNLTIPELEVSSDTIPGGQTTSFEFTADKTGTFNSLCTVGDHAERGMRGEVMVQ